MIDILNALDLVISMCSLITDYTKIFYMIQKWDIPSRQY
jgi:hypothetical protein